MKCIAATLFVILGVALLLSTVTGARAEEPRRTFKEVVLVDWEGRTTRVPFERIDSWGWDNGASVHERTTILNLKKGEDTVGIRLGDLLATISQVEFIEQKSAPTNPGRRVMVTNRKGNSGTYFLLEGRRGRLPSVVLKVQPPIDEITGQKPKIVRLVLNRYKSIKPVWRDLPCDPDTGQVYPETYRFSPFTGKPLRRD